MSSVQGSNPRLTSAIGSSCPSPVQKALGIMDWHEQFTSISHYHPLSRLAWVGMRTNSKLLMKSQAILLET